MPIWHQRHHYLNRAQCVFSDVLPCSPAVSSTATWVPWAGAILSSPMSQLPICGNCAGAAQPVAAGLLAVDVAEHRALFLPCEPRGEMCSQCRFAAAALGVGDQYPVHVSQSVEKWGCCAAHAKHRAAPVVAPAGIEGRLRAG